MALFLLPDNIHSAVKLHLASAQFGNVTSQMDKPVVFESK
jgi:hypothetical protein